MSEELAHFPCQGKCSWSPSNKTFQGEPLFVCGGCSSEWVPSQPWTPKNYDGEIAPEVAVARSANQTQA